MLLLLAAALAFFFLYPRPFDLYIEQPEDGLQNIQIAVYTQEKDALNGLLHASPMNPFSVQLNLSFVMSAFSHNYYNLWVKKASARVYFVAFYSVCLYNSTTTK